MIAALLAGSPGVVWAGPKADPIKFGVISDLHFYDTHLGTSGQAFQYYLAKDPKLLVESEAILDSALKSLVDQHLKFVLVCGDMTKDGELKDHVQVAQRFAQLEHDGVQVFVVPGKHDINSPDQLFRLAPRIRVIRVIRDLHCPQFAASW